MHEAARTSLPGPSVLRVAHFSKRKSESLPRDGIRSRIWRASRHHIFLFLTTYEIFLEEVSNCGLLALGLFANLGSSQKLSGETIQILKAEGEGSGSGRLAPLSPRVCMRAWGHGAGGDDRVG
jgi:hypothetical protein